MIYLFVFILLHLLELLYFRIANHFNIIDKPNERSSHSRITLRGGGVVFYFGVLLYFLFNGFQFPWFLGGLTLISLISFADDVKPQSSKLRLLVHFVAMVLMFYQWGLFDSPWYFMLIALIFCTGIINAYNFMDGINGITGGYSLVVAGALAIINKYFVEFTDGNLIYFLVISLLVFIFFNFRKKAKCFAGDVGAVSVAFILLFLIGQLILKTGNFNYILLLAVYGVDSILTIVHRIFLHENIFQPHRKHVYQLMANELKIPQVLVSSIYAFIQMLIVAGLLLTNCSTSCYFVIVITVLSIVYIAMKVKYFHLHKF